ncbi:transposase family protein [Nocardia vaccinii]|uniref:transposase family protein n=1 Tax=Nocardia vaccinii TaxID=1822 RepID=UPI0012F4DD86
MRVLFRLRDADTGRVHSRYQRRLSDTSITGREVVIGLRVRRLFCDNSDCGKTTSLSKCHNWRPATPVAH